jgi:type I restriction enzyme S subunit
VFGWAKVNLGDVCDLITGATPSTGKKEYWENGTIPWMNSGEVNLRYVTNTKNMITRQGYDNVSTTIVPIHSVVIALAGQGKTRGTVALLKTTVCTNQSLAALVPNTKMVSGEYLYHYLRTQYMKLREVSAGDGTRGGLNLKMLRSYKVIIPPMEEQQRIVDILERFDTLTTDITAGLPAEIEARRKQYEYYRDQLLTFKQKA